MPDDIDDDLPPLAHHAEVGFPRFEHSQWTVEGEIERFGAFGRAGAQARGWKRYAAVGVALTITAPILVGLVASLWQALT